MWRGTVARLEIFNQRRLNPGFLPHDGDFQQPHPVVFYLSGTGFGCGNDVEMRQQRLRDTTSKVGTAGADNKHTCVARNGSAGELIGHNVLNGSGHIEV